VDAVRQGSRWLHSPPSEEAVREWFKAQTLHDGMEHDPYVGGVVLIAATQKTKVTREKANGEQYVAEEEHAEFVPYVKADTRIRYFWDLVDAMNGLAEETLYVGTIEPVAQRRITDNTSAYYNEHLPEGFFALPVTNEDRSVARYVGCQMRVAIYERQSWGERVNGRDSLPVLAGIGTKQTKLSTRWADDNALMKVETGAVGRALGMAGVLVVGTGVATAEDMQEAISAPQGGGTPVVDREGQSVAPPPVVGGSDIPADAPAAQEPGDGGLEAAVAEAVDEEEALRERALVLQKEMETEFPDVWAAYKEWWTGRKFGPLSSLNGPALKGAVTKLERDLDAARNPSDG
jgi:hypothetical protein